MPATLKQLLEVRSQLVEEVLTYLDAVARWAAEVPAYYPEELQSVELGETRFDHIRQVVQVVDRRAFEDYLKAQNKAREGERQRAAGYPDERKIYKPVRARREDGFREEEDRDTSPWEDTQDEPIPVVWDDRAGALYPRAVVLGDPGSGKTWLLRWEARRLARVAARELGEERTKHLEEITIAVFLRLSDLHDHGGPIEQAIRALVSEQHSSACADFIMRKLASPQGVLLLDALDEVSETARNRLKARLHTFAIHPKYAQTRILITSRVVGYPGSPLPNGQELEILSFDWPQIENFVAVRFSKEHPDAQAFLGVLRQQAQISGLARIPLMLALMCRAFQAQHLRFPTRRVELYECCLRGLLRDWKAQRSESEGIPEAEASAEYVDGLLELLGPVAFHLFEQGYEQFRSSVLRQYMMPYLRALQAGHELYQRSAAKLIAELKRDGILIQVGAGKTAPLLFLHRTFQEYLAARHITLTLQPGSIPTPTTLVAPGQWETDWTLLDKKAWLPEWQEVIVLLAGQLSDPTPLLQLLGKGRDDYFRHRLALAARCLPELDSTQRDKCSGLVDDITTAAFSLLWWQYGLNFTVEAIPLTRARPALPGLIRALSALGQVNGRMVDTPLLEWLCQQLRNTDQKVRAAAVRAVGMLGDVAATEPILTRLAELLDVAQLLDDKRVRAAVVWAVERLGGAETTESFLIRLAELLDNKNWKVWAEVAWAMRGGAATTESFLIRLAELLDNKNWSVWAEAVKGGAAAEPILTRMAKRLDDADERVRVAAEPILTRMAQRLDDNGEVRAAAVWTMERLGGAAATKSFLRRLAEMLDNKNQWVRAEAVRAVGALGSAALTNEDILRRLAEQLDDADEGMRGVAAEAVRRLGSAAATEPFLAGLAGLLKDENERIRAAAVRAVESLGGAAATKSFLTRLAEQLSDAEWWVREAAVEAVRRLGSAALTNEDILPRLVSLAKRLDDENERVRRAAIRAVGALGDVAAIESFLTRLAERLSDKDLAGGAAMAVGDVELLGSAAATESFLTRLAKLLDDEDRNVQLAAVYAVRALGSAALINKDILPRLTKRLGDEDWPLQEAAAEAVSALGGVVASKTFLTRLVERLHDENMMVRKAAVELVGKLGSAVLTNKDIPPRLAKLLDDENEWVREAAAKAVGRLGSAAATEPIRTRLAELLFDVELKVRTAAAAAVAALGSAAATEPILTHLAKLLDDNWAGQPAAKALERFMAQRVRIFKGRGSKWEGRTVEELSR